MVILYAALTSKNVSTPSADKYVSRPRHHPSCFNSSLSQNSAAACPSKAVRMKTANKAMSHLGLTLAAHSGKTWSAMPGPGGTDPNSNASSTTACILIRQTITASSERLAFIMFICAAIRQNTFPALRVHNDHGQRTAGSPSRPCFDKILAVKTTISSPQRYALAGSAQAD